MSQNYLLFLQVRVFPRISFPFNFAQFSTIFSRRGRIDFQTFWRNNNISFTCEIILLIFKTKIVSEKFLTIKGKIGFRRYTEYLIIKEFWTRVPTKFAILAKLLDQSSLSRFDRLYRFDRTASFQSKAHVSLYKKDFEDLFLWPLGQNFRSITVIQVNIPWLNRPALYKLVNKTLITKFVIRDETQNNVFLRVETIYENYYLCHNWANHPFFG